MRGLCSRARWLVLLAAPFLLILLTACGASRKTSSSSRVTRDSVAVSRVDSAAVYRTDSSGVSKTGVTIVTEKDRTDMDRVIITLDTAGASGSDSIVVMNTHSGTPGDDHFVIHVPKRAKSVEVIKARTDHSRDSSAVSRTDSVHLVQTDSTRVASSDSTGVHATTEKRESKKTRVGFTAVGIFAVLIIGFLYYQYRRRLGLPLIPGRRRQAPPPG